MKVVRVTHPGTNEALRLSEEAMPELGRRDVLIKMRAASLNFRDLLIVNGHYAAPLKAMPVALSDGAGEVVALGPDVTRLAVGDRVSANCQCHWIGGPFIEEYHSASIGMTIDGMLAEYVVLDENAIVRLPDYLSFVEAASLPCAAVSAWSALTFGMPITAGQSVLVQGTGGVALFALQIARMFGARVLAITSSDAKADKLRELGASAVVNYNETPDWSTAILDLTGGVGVDRIVEIGGEATLRQSARCIKIGAQIGVVGLASGIGGGVSSLDIMQRTVGLQGIAVGPRLSFEALLSAMEIAQVHPIIDSVFPFADYQGAYRRLEAGSHVGKVVIDFDGSVGAD